jgi:hypothetical protein
MKAIDVPTTILGTRRVRLVTPGYTPTGQMLADGLTKTLTYSLI